MGAAVGLMGPAMPRGVADLSFTDPVIYYWIFLAVLAVLLTVTWLMQRSRFGYYLRAINGNDRAARSLGVPCCATSSTRCCSPPPSPPSPARSTR